MTNDFKISLKAARVNAEMTAKEVGKKIGKTEKTILNWENAKTPITAENFYGLCNIYGINSDFVKVPVSENKNDFFYNQATV